MSGPLPPDFPVAWRSSSGLQYKGLKIRTAGIKRSSTLYKEDNIPAFSKRVRLHPALLTLRFVVSSRRLAQSFYFAAVDPHVHRLCKEPF